VKAAALILLTLNVAGPRRVHQGWPSRRAAIVERLAAEKPDAAAFQEIWRRDDADALAAGAGHAPGAFDERSGLALSSRHPLSERAALDLGEGYGALCARAAAPAGALTLCSVRLEPGLGAAKARRVGQLVEAAEFVRARASSSPFVVLGDLGASADDPETRLFLDLLGGRDLCVRHGDEVCGRTREDSRVDFAVVPYSSKEPGGASTAFTELSGPPEDPVPLPPRFGLKAELLPAAAKLRAAARPEGRAEALETAIHILEDAREAVPPRRAADSWVPWRGALDAAASDRELARLERWEELAKSALIRGQANSLIQPGTQLGR
jgi:endonuclease/exonuclease/phosphatase family metal-dependent hydrolase